MTETARRPAPSFTAATLRPADEPTFYFIGVTTGSSSIQRVFPAWAHELGLDARLQGIDLPLHAAADDYRRVVDFIAQDELSLGGLVTTHKIDLFRAARDRFDVIDELAQLMGETSCISKRGGRLISHAKDPISSGRALDAFVPAGHWARTGADVVSMGAGGSTLAISWYLSRPERGADRPRRIVITNRSQPRLEHAASVTARFATDTPFDFVLAPDARDNDEVIAAAPPGSLVVNATGLGKDAPGSPVTDAASWPQGGLAWDLNYRGDLVFLDQARRQPGLAVEDGWTYFLHGWTAVIAEVFDVELPSAGPDFETLSRLAQEAR
ncbi:shikimate dehydrogenase family protein [Gryllotalpicola reticulitermitis]|uniref:Shikimate dehydrogenase family protein n=1 Tax=Gryllotalpicola reticulitermitis TaxID=1184153 RepID=A0ABV8Q464_9MICO